MAKARQVTHTLSVSVGSPSSADVLKYVCDVPRPGRSSDQGGGVSMQRSSGDGEAASQATAEMSEADLEDDMAEQEEIIVYQVGRGDRPLLVHR